MEKITHEQMIELVGRLVRTEYDDEDESDRMLDQLIASTGEKYIAKLIFWPDPDDADMTPEEIVDKALQHRPKPPIEL